MKKILVVYYSRTGTTKKVADLIALKVLAKIEEIKDTVARSGPKGYLISGRDAALRRLTKLENQNLNPADFDLVIIGTPIWSWNISVPIRTYITDNKDRFKEVAFFCTMSGSGDKRAFEEMSSIIGKKPIATLGLLTKEVISGQLEKAEEFIKEINNFNS